MAGLCVRACVRFNNLVFSGGSKQPLQPLIRGLSMSKGFLIQREKPRINVLDEYGIRTGA